MYKIILLFCIFEMLIFKMLWIPSMQCFCSLLILCVCALVVQAGFLCIKRLIKIILSFCIYTILLLSQYIHWNETVSMYSFYYIQMPAKLFEHLRIFSGLIANFYNIILIINNIKPKDHDLKNIYFIKLRKIWIFWHEILKCSKNFAVDFNLILLNIGTFSSIM